MRAWNKIRLIPWKEIRLKVETHTESLFVHCGATLWEVRT